MNNRTVGLLLALVFVSGWLGGELMVEVLWSKPPEKVVVVRTVESKIPEKQPEKVVEASKPKIGEKYVVVKGDSLWKIADRVYGSGLKWPVLYYANRKRLKNKNLVRAGQVLEIPDPKIAKDMHRRWVPKGYEFWKTVTAKVTAYEPSARSCYPFADGKTSIGRNAWRMNGVAADPAVIPYGTMVKIPKIGWRKVDDTGGAMKRSTRRGVYHIDVRMRYVSQARRWGNPWLRVDLYKRVRGKRLACL